MRLSEVEENQKKMCPHKDVIDGYCKKCCVYLCNSCQVRDHCEHIEEIIGLDRIYTEAALNYEHSVSQIEKDIQNVFHTNKEYPFDQTLLKVEARVNKEHDKLLEDLKSLEGKQIITSPIMSLKQKLEKSKDELDNSEDIQHLSAFNEKLGTAISRLLEVFESGNYDQVKDLLEESAKDQFVASAKKFDPYYEKQKAFLRECELLKSIKPKLAYDNKTIDNLVVVSGVYEDNNESLSNNSK